MDDDDRDSLLRLSKKDLVQVAAFCNRYPVVEVSYELESGRELQANVPTSLLVQVERELDEDDELGPVIAPHYPKVWITDQDRIIDVLQRKEEGWWLVLGIPETNELLAIKRVSFTHKAKAKLDFTPVTAGMQTYQLTFVCDSYIGCDPQHDIEVNVLDNMDES